MAAWCEAEVEGEQEAPTDMPSGFLQLSLSVNYLPNMIHPLNLDNSH